jgi:hypothetical protein
VLEPTWQPEEQSLLQTRIVPHARTEAKSTRTSQIDGQRWDFFPTNHQLFASMVYVVG